MRTYISIVLLSLLSTSLAVNLQGITSDTTKLHSSLRPELVAAAKKPRDKSPQRGSGRREFFQLNKEVTPLA